MSASDRTGSEWTWREDIFIIRSAVMNHAVHIWTGRWSGAAVGGELLPFIHTFKWNQELEMLFSNFPHNTILIFKEVCV